MFCSQCGNQYEGNFCSKCGRQVSDPKVSSNELQPIACGEQYSAEVNAGKVIEISAGPITLSGQRKQITDIEVLNDKFIVTNYLNTKINKASSISSFTKNEISSIVYKKTPVTSKMDIIRYIISVPASVIPPFCLGVLISGITYWRSLRSTMLVHLSNGKIVRIFYMDKKDTEELNQLFIK